jgi:dTDP-glucose pyrophosphorylase
MIYIDKSCTLIEALKKMDFLERKLLIVTSENNFFGLLSVGDIQRAIIKNYDLNTSIEKIIRKNIKVARKTDDFESIKKMMIEYRMEFCPVIGEDNSIAEIYYWEDVFKETQRIQFAQFNLPIVIMAGGIGSRLKPLTNVIPKPLIPIGDKSMLEHIFERFYKHGSDTFFISVNYKAELIKFYLKEQNLPYNLNYFKEEKPSGTAGSLSLLKGKLKSTFFVSNCDILIEEDYSEILKYHNENKNEITIIAALKHYSIPYGTLETAEDGKLVSLQEKPELNFMINSGLYLLEPHLLNEIPENTFFHITDLIDIVKKRKGNIGVFPVSEASWFDTGEWSEYNKTQGLLTKKN